LYYVYNEFTSETLVFSITHANVYYWHAFSYITYMCIYLAEKSTILHVGNDTILTCDTLTGHRYVVTVAY